MLLAALPRRLGAAGTSGNAAGAVWELPVDLEGGLPRLGFLVASSWTTKDSDSPQSSM